MHLLLLFLTSLIIIEAFDNAPSFLNNFNSDQKFYFTIKNGDQPEEDVVFKLFPKAAPRTATNFAALTTGLFQNADPALSFKNSIFHRVIKSFMIQGGDTTDKYIFVSILFQFVFHIFLGMEEAERVSTGETFLMKASNCVITRLVCCQWPMQVPFHPSKFMFLFHFVKVRIRTGVNFSSQLSQPLGSTENTRFLGKFWKAWTTS